MPPQITCASALPVKMAKHENHIFHSIGLCYTQCTCVLSSWKKNCHLWCVWQRLTFVEIVRYPINTLHWLLFQAWRRTTLTFCTATDTVTDLANTEDVGTRQQDAMLPSYRSCLVHPVDRFRQWRVVQLWPGDILNCVSGFFWWKCMQHLSEKMRFPGYLLPQVVQKH